MYESAQTSKFEEYYMKIKRLENIPKRERTFKFVSYKDESNGSKRHYILVNDIRFTVPQYAKYLGLTATNIYNRLAIMPVEEALYEKATSNKKKSKPKYQTIHRNPEIEQKYKAILKREIKKFKKEAMNLHSYMVKTYPELY